MADLPQISEAKFEVMKIIWKYAPISKNEITERLTKTTSWSPNTIQTLIKRLVTKGILSYFLIIKLLMFLVCKNHVCCWRSAPLLLTLCCSYLNLLQLK